MSRRGKDEGIWEKVAEGIAPLPPRAKRRTAKIALAPAKPAKSVKPAKAPKPAKIAVARPAAPKPAPLPDLSHARAPGLDSRSFERLRRGRLPIEARLDLHGHTLEAAHRALIDFVGRAWAAERRAVLVITGKGGRGGEDGPRATLRQSVPRWLNEAALRPKILAFTRAQPQHGGAGALYVLLKRKRRD